MLTQQIKDLVNHSEDVLSIKGFAKKVEKYVENDWLVLNYKNLKECNNLHEYAGDLCYLNLSRFEEWKNSDLVEIYVHYMHVVIMDCMYYLIQFEKMMLAEIKNKSLELNLMGLNMYLNGKGIADNSPAASQMYEEIQDIVKTAAYKAFKCMSDHYEQECNTNYNINLKFVA